GGEGLQGALHHVPHGPRRTLPGGQVQPLQDGAGSSHLQGAVHDLPHGARGMRPTGAAHDLPDGAVLRELPGLQAHPDLRAGMRTLLPQALPLTIAFYPLAPVFGARGFTLHYLTDFTGFPRFSSDMSDLPTDKPVCPAEHTRIREALEKAGWRFTRQRAAVLNYLHSVDDH